MEPEVLLYFELKNHIIKYRDDDENIRFIDLKAMLHHGEVTLPSGLFYENDVLQFYNLKDNVIIKTSPLLYKSLKRKVENNSKMRVFVFKKYIDWKLNNDMSLLNKIVIPIKVIEPKRKVLKKV